MEKISQDELNERIALIKKFKELLQQQRAKFQEYLTVLEKQESSIEKENASSLLAHTELEQQVVANIMNLQKVIVPMSELYNSKAADIKDEHIASIQKELEDLQSKVLSQNEKNRILLKSHIVQIRSQLANLQNPYKHNRSVYAEKQNAGTMVMIEA